MYAYRWWKMLFGIMRFRVIVSHVPSLRIFSIPARRAHEQPGESPSPHVTLSVFGVFTKLFEHGHGVRETRRKLTKCLQGVLAGCTIIPSRHICRNSNTKGNLKRMASTTFAQQVTLGDIAVTHGGLGPKHAHAAQDQLENAIRILSDNSSYSADLENCVICVDDRLSPNGLRKHAPRLAGGALSLGLMYHLLYDGDTLSDCLRELKRLGFYLVMHNDCGALQLAPSLIPERLSNIEADGYKMLEALGLETDDSLRRRIATWASSLSKDFFDVDESKRIVDEVEDVTGRHNAVAAAVSLRDGESFVASPELSEQTGGLLAFAFDPWAAKLNGVRIGVALEESAAAERLGQLLTAEVLLQLADVDLNIIIHE